MRNLYTFLIALLMPFLAQSQVGWNFTTASPSSGVPVSNISTISDISQGNNNGTTTLITTTSASSGYTGASGGGNAGAAARTGALSTAAGGTAYFECTLTPVAGAAISITQLNFGSRSTGTGPQAFAILTSLDNFTAAVASGTLSNTSSWGLQSNALSLSVPAGQAITIRIYGYNGSGSAAANTANWRIDDLAISATASGGSGPGATLAVSPASLSGFSTTAGTASASQSTQVSGTNLSGNVSISATGGYEVSTDNSNFSATATLSPAAGTLGNTAVYARISAAATAGSVNGSLTVSSTGATTQTVSLSGTATGGTTTTANVVINQVYGGGGNSGSTYKNDFIELYNNENFPVSLSGWSVQYSNATGSTWNTTALSGTIPAHSFFLIQEAAGTGGTTNLPAADVTGTINIGATSGKVILSNSTATLSGANPTGTAVIDKLGFGSTATGYETSPAPAPDNTTSVQRITDGVDNNNNATDFKVAAPIPRNSTYTTAAPAILSLNPPTGASGIPASYPLALVFDKPVLKGTGNITIVENGTALAPISVQSAAVAITNNNTVTISATLTGGKSYYILIDAGSFKDVYSNNFAGISGNSTWAFTTYNSAVATTIPVNFDFQTCTGSGLLPNGFTQYSVSGAQVWDCTVFGRDPNAPTGTAAYPNAVQINGYANGVNNFNQDWLISPKLDLSGTNYPLLAFWSRNAFSGDPLRLKISTNYSGSGDPTLATWTDLNGKFPPVGSDTWTQSSGINLSAFKSGSVYIAFVYTSTTDDGSRWTLDDISLTNSSTPPAPSLTVSTGSLTFGYAAFGSSADRSITVTGNDLTSDITLTAGSPFQVSSDGSHFGPTATLQQAVANNTAQTVYLRFTPSVTNKLFSDSLQISMQDTTAKVYLSGNSVDPASTLNIINWNLNWFGTPDATLGPTDKNLQIQNVGTILPTLGADLYALQEVVNEPALAGIVQNMPGYAYVINNYGSHSNTTESGPSPLNQVQKLAFVYNTAKIHLVRTDSLLSIGVNTAADVSTLYYNDWASGRFPYMLTADVTLSDNNGGTISKRMRFINIHAKANTAPVLTAYARRKDGAHALDSLIRADFSNDPVVVLGDFNDDLNQTITAGVNPPVTSYSSFTIDNPAQYIFPSKPLSPSGQHSDVNYTSVIDNVVATNALSSYYLPGSATVLSQTGSLVPKYGTTTTDHYPVFSQFSFAPPTPLPVLWGNFTAVAQKAAAKLSWTTMQESNTKEFVVERSNDGQGYSPIGTVAAKGNSSVPSAYEFYDRQPLSGNNYYRLNQIDLDGKAAYSKVVTLNFSLPVTLAINPNPAHGTAHIRVNANTDGFTIQLVNMNGQLLQQRIAAAGETDIPVDLSGLSAGIYTVKLIGRSGTTTQKLLVQ